MCHSQMRIIHHLTRSARTAAGQTLRRLVKDLSAVRDEAAVIDLAASSRTLVAGLRSPHPERTMIRNGQWGFTHDRLRTAWLLMRLVTRRQTFSTLERLDA